MAFGVGSMAVKRTGQLGFVDALVGEVVGGIGSAVW